MCTILLSCCFGQSFFFSFSRPGEREGDQRKRARHIPINHVTIAFCLHIFICTLEERGRHYGLIDLSLYLEHRREEGRGIWHVFRTLADTRENREYL